MKLRARTNGNEYQTDNPHLAYPLYCTEEQAREWIANGILELIEELKPAAKVEEPKNKRAYTRRDMVAEGTEQRKVTPEDEMTPESDETA